MARKPTRGAAVTVGKAVAPADAVKVQYVLEQRHVAAIRQEAIRRAAERQSGGLDASEALRSILDGWIARGGKR